MSKIEWTEKTWNPITGCTKISPGCKNCYAEKMAKRLAGRFGYPKDDPFKVTLHNDRLMKPHNWKKPSMIFVNSMSDLFHEDVDEKFLLSILATIQTTPRHTYQILTKRPDIAVERLSKLNLPKNLWIGTSIESNGFIFRMYLLWDINVPVRFVSFEPLLTTVGTNLDLSETEWVIVGCESGPKRRPMDVRWAREIKEQCEKQGVAFFMKQMEIDGKVCKDINQFPTDLQVREYPNVR